MYCSSPIIPHICTISTRTVQCSPLKRSVRSTIDVTLPSLMYRPGQQTFATLLAFFVRASRMTFLDRTFTLCYDAYGNSVFYPFRIRRPEWVVAAAEKVHKVLTLTAKKRDQRGFKKDRGVKSIATRIADKHIKVLWSVYWDLLAADRFWAASSSTERRCFMQFAVS